MSELDELIKDVTLSRQTRDEARRVKLLENQIAAQGFDPESGLQGESALMTALDLIDTPRQFVAGVIDTALAGETFGKDAEGNSIGLGGLRGIERGTTTSDILRQHDIIDDPLLRAGVGYIGDVATDPFTYLSFGGLAGVKAGGRTLTKEGAGLLAKVQAKAAAATDDIISQSHMVESTFKAAADMSDLKKSLNLAKDPLEVKYYTDLINHKREITEGLLSPDELELDIFKESGLYLATRIPFLGKKKDNFEIIDPKSKSAFMASKMADSSLELETGIKFSDKKFDIVRKLDESAREKLSKFRESVETIPHMKEVIGNVEDATKYIINGINKTFNTKAGIGESARDTIREYRGTVEANKYRAFNRIRESFNSEELLDTVAHKDSYIVVDSVIQNTIKQIELNAERKAALTELHRVANGGQISPNTMAIFNEAFDKSFDDLVFKELDKFKLDPSIPESTKSILDRSLALMKEAHELELENGIDSSFLSVYLPNVYANFGKMKSNSTKTRGFDTWEDAFNKRGLTVSTSLPQILAKRLENTYNRISEKNYFNRLLIDEGLPSRSVAEMYRQAADDPNSVAAALLNRSKVYATPVDKELLEDGSLLAIRKSVLNSESIPKATKEQLLQKPIDEFAAEMHSQMMQAGQRPKDKLTFQTWRDEAGVTYKDGAGRNVILPKPIRDAWDEARQNRDIIKEAFGKTDFGRKTLNLLDSTTNAFKFMVTRPFAAYWAGNMLGDRFQDLMRGIGGLESGLPARTYSVLNGTGVIRTPSGAVIDQKTIRKIINEIEPNYNASNFSDTIGYHAGLDVQKMAQAELSSSTLLKKSAKDLATGQLKSSADNAVTALKKMNEAAAFGFDGMFKVQHLVGRLEKGDTISQAIKSTRERYFDYADLTQIEKDVFRRFFMFYGYMSKATKQTMTSLIKQPAYINRQRHAVNAISEIFSDPDAAPSFQEQDSKYLRSLVNSEQISRVIGKNEEGKTLVGRGFFAPVNSALQQFSVSMPRSFRLGDLFDSISNDTTRTIQKQFATANPFIKGAAELLSDKNLYFNKPLSEKFLRTVPSLNTAVEKLTGLSHDDLPIDLDAATKTFLRAVPDGKGRLVAEKNRFWILMNVVPGLSRLNSMGNSLTNKDIPTSRSLLRTLSGINIEVTEGERSYLRDRRRQLESFIDSNLVRERAAYEKKKRQNKE